MFKGISTLLAHPLALGFTIPIGVVVAPSLYAEGCGKYTGHMADGEHGVRDSDPCPFACYWQT
jgi:hypothetical protein